MIVDRDLETSSGNECLGVKVSEEVVSISSLFYLVMRLSIMFPDEIPKPPTDSCESPVGEANTGLIGPDIRAKYTHSENTQQFLHRENNN